MIPTPATEEQKKQAMDKAAFDLTVISDSSRYIALRDFLLFYGDTIISYRDNRNYVIVVHGGNQTDTVLQKQDCYSYFQGNRNYDISNVPDILKQKLDSIYKVIGDNNIRSFEVCKDRKVQIHVRTDGGENGLFISHTLMWNSKLERDYAYSDNKDTVINGNCIYRIGMTEHHGH
jgi:hypothetical protein